MMEFYDYDPETGEVATEAVRLRIKQGLKELLERLQRPLNETQERDQKRKLDEMRRHNDWIAQRDGYFIPPGCVFPISPALARLLGTKTPDDVPGV